MTGAPITTSRTHLGRARCGNHRAPINGNPPPAGDWGSLVCHLDKAYWIVYNVSMMMNPRMTKEYELILSNLLATIPPANWKALTQEQVSLLLQGLSELDARTVLMPTITETILQHRPIPVAPYRPRS